MLLLFLVALLVACVSIYVATNKETMVLDAETRARLGGTYAALGKGDRAPRCIRDSD